MYNTKNKVQLIGNLGAAPEVRTTEGGRKVVKLRMATNDSYKNAAGEKVIDTQWHYVVAWGSTAEFAEKHLQKGSEILVEGRITTRQYADKDGVTKYVTEIQANNLLILDRKEAPVNA